MIDICRTMLRCLMPAATGLLLTGCVAFMPDRIHYVWDDPAGATAPASPLSAGEDFVGLAFSGGGSRAALFAAAGAEALSEHGLLDDVTHISSVSGGSMAASYLAAHPPEACRGTACGPAYFSAYKGAMRQNYLWPMERRQALNPERFLSPTRRIESLRESFDHAFLEARTFGDLAGGRVLLINAASYDDGRRFVFSNAALPPLADPPAPLNVPTLTARDFQVGDCAARTPDDFPLSLAVAASAAFPPALGPVAIEAPPACGSESTQFWHLGDGGILENTGIETLQEVILRLDAAGAPPARAVIFAFDAGKKEAAETSLANHNLRLWTTNPGQVVSITNIRGDAYRDIVWGMAQERLSFPVEIISIRYTDHVPETWPASCGGAERNGESIEARLQQVPTRFSISPCDGDLIEAAARLGVQRALTENPHIASWLTP